MQKFMKTDYVDEDEEIVTTIEANSLQEALENTLKELLTDDRLCPCYGVKIEDTLSIVHESIEFAPGDGGGYSIVTIDRIE